MIIPFIAFIAGCLLIYLLFQLKFGSFHNYQLNTLIETDAKVQKALLTIKEKELESKAELKIEEETKKLKLQKVEEQLKSQHEEILSKLKKIEKREQQLNEKEQQLKEKEKKVFELAQMSELDAKQFLLNKYEAHARKEASTLIKKIEEEALRTAKEKAQSILSTAIQRLSLPSLNSIATSGIPIEDEDVKGKVVGKEGRNIRTFEELTGTTVLMDESPHSIIISCFDPIRREIATRALKILINEGKIHPSRIEDVVASVQDKVEEIMMQKGEEACAKVNIQSLNPELIKLLGKLHFRYSLGQNLLEHSIEVSHLLGLIAEELGLNGHLGRKIGLLHDIGKAVVEYKEKSHALIGMEMARKYGEKEDVANGIGCHHFEVEAITLEGSLCHVADAISASRSGARVDRLDFYVKRMQDIESETQDIAGIEKVYVLQMGKEIRIIVHPDLKNDHDLKEIARLVKERVHSKNLTTGKVKLTLCCEKKFVEMI